MGQTEESGGGSLLQRGRHDDRKACGFQPSRARRGRPTRCSSFPQGWTGV